MLQVNLKLPTVQTFHRAVFGEPSRARRLLFGDCCLLMCILVFRFSISKKKIRPSDISFQLFYIGNVLTHYVLLFDVSQCDLLKTVSWPIHDNLLHIMTWKESGLIENHITSSYCYTRQCSILF